jgi:hypothetical protein
MKRIWVLLIFLFVIILIAGCIDNNSKNKPTETISNEEQGIHTYQTTAATTPIITSTPTLKVTSIPTPIKTSTPTLKVTSMPTPIKTSTPTPKVTNTQSNTYNKQSSSNDAVSCPPGKCWVNPYTKKDGTNVKGYCRKC